jgi:putative membrane protein insertion efficiency factor
VKSRIRKFSTFVLLSLIRAYQVMVSPLLVPACRFQPSCSQYMLEAVDLHGPLRGGIMGLRRLLRCHPFRKGGYDPVPQ